MEGIDEVLHKEVVAGCFHVPALQLLQAERTAQEAEIARLRSEVKTQAEKISRLEDVIQGLYRKYG